MRKNIFIVSNCFRFADDGGPETEEWEEEEEAESEVIYR